MNWVVCSNYGWQSYKTRPEVQEKIVELESAGIDLNTIIIFHRGDQHFQSGETFLDNIKLKGMVEHNRDALTRLITDCRKIIDEEGVPLDGDAVERVAECIRIWIDFHEGNITEEEYELC